MNENNKNIFTLSYSPIFDDWLVEASSVVTIFEVVAWVLEIGSVVVVCVKIDSSVVVLWTDSVVDTGSVLSIPIDKHREKKFVVIILNLFYYI